ncbi:MAG: nuclear transport factor 2 family protein [Dehalococcoidia bacterium]
MASNTDLAKQYVAAQQARNFDELVTLLSDDVELNMPMVGKVEGKAAVEERLRNQPGGGGQVEISWSDPEEEGEAVRVVGTGAPFGPINLVLSFNGSQQIAKIDVAIGRNGGGFQPPPLNMSWAKAPTERPPSLPKDLGPEGFTLAKADAGSYGWAPDHWPYQNDTPRGAWPAPPSMRGLAAPYTIYEKHEVWADNAADLYELAIRERWIPATEISWGSIEPIEEHTEAALDQLFTNISEQQYNSNQMLMGWLMQISYGFHEVKLYLATEVFDLARHTEAFRKRALSNGGGLGVQMPGFMHRTVYAAFKFTELITYINILRGSFTLALCEWGDKLGRSQADRQLFDNTANDLRRHLAYGVDHLKHYIRYSPENHDRVATWLTRGEAMMAADLGRDKPLREALILALGDTVEEGKARLKELRQAQLQKYLLTLEAASIYNHAENVNRALNNVIENP